MVRGSRDDPGRTDDVGARFTSGTHHPEGNLSTIRDQCFSDHHDINLSDAKNKSKKLEEDVLIQIYIFLFKYISIYFTFRGVNNFGDKFPDRCSWSG